MATYAIGDVQGCYKELCALIKSIQFNPNTDYLWFTGDLVNRGPQSLEVLQLIYDLGDRQKMVLGNHDLHLLAVAYGKPLAPKDTIKDVLISSEKYDLIEWLKMRPLLVYDASLQYVLVHAGLAAAWTLTKAEILAKEVESCLQTNPETFLPAMYGNEPNYWDDALSGMERLRAITNFLTRMRYCDEKGHLNLDYKGTIAERPDGLVPWFLAPERQNANDKIIFGHWAALGGVTSVKNLYPLDTGCVWGNYLTAMRLEDGKRFQVRYNEV